MANKEQQFLIISVGSAYHLALAGGSNLRHLRKLQADREWPVKIGLTGAIPYKAGNRCFWYWEVQLGQSAGAPTVEQLCVLGSLQSGS